MKTYTLYLDESETNKNQNLHAYAIGGIIVEILTILQHSFPKLIKSSRKYGQT